MAPREGVVNMSDFGVAGKRTVREFDGAVKVHVSKGQHLFFRLTVQGAEPIFSFVCQDKARLSEHQFPGHPKKVYEWNWSKEGDESDRESDVYGVTMSFFTAIRYTLVVEHREDDGTLIDLLKDIDYESNHPADNFTETLRILTA
jgi:hypothetical protein